MQNTNKTTALFEGIAKTNTTNTMRSTEAWQDEFEGIAKTNTTNTLENPG